MTFFEKTNQLVNDEIKFNLLIEYVNLIEQTNKTINLTGFTGDKLWEEGIYETLVSFQSVIKNNNLLVLDVGSGMGLPGIPLKIIYPKIKLTIYEPIEKRVKFLNLVNQTLGLNLEIIKTRSEDIKVHEQFDLILARAVAPLKSLIEITHHLGKVPSEFIFVKGPNYYSEIENAKIIIDNLKINLHLKKKIINNKKIVLICFFKNYPTPKIYPRPWSIIKNEKS